MLPNVELQVAIRGGLKFIGSIHGTGELMSASFPTSKNPFKYLSGSNVGVDIVVSAGNGVETQASAAYLGDLKITQIHTVATDTDLTINQKFPYRLQTTPVDSFQGTSYEYTIVSMLPCLTFYQYLGFALHYIVCEYYKFTRISVFVTNELFGTIALEEMADQDECPWTFLSVHTVVLGLTDFTTEIGVAKAAGSSIFVILLDSTSGAALLEQGYDQGLFKQGVQIFGANIYLILCNVKYYMYY
jgi:hypothetical protein